MHNEDLSAGTKDHSEHRLIDSMSSPTIGNTDVVCSQSHANFYDEQSELGKKSFSEEDKLMGQQIAQVQVYMKNFYETQLDFLYEELDQLLKTNNNDIFKFLLEAKRIYNMTISVFLHKGKDEIRYSVKYDEAIRLIKEREVAYQILQPNL